jgi:hypothetical protein
MSTTPKTKESILSALSKNTPAELIETKPVVVQSFKPTEEQLAKDAEEDYAFTRERVKKLAETSDEAIAIMLNLATDSEHPRAFEVLANLIKTAADVNNQISTIQKDRKKVHADPTSKKGTAIVTAGPSTTNNVIFTGTTSDLQKFLTKRTASQITVEA